MVNSNVNHVKNLILKKTAKKIIKNRQWKNNKLLFQQKARLNCNVFRYSIWPTQIGLVILGSYFEG